MATDPPRRDTADAQALDDAGVLDLEILCGLFRRWVQSRARPDLLLIDPDGPGSLPLEEALERLCSASSPLGAACARQLGLPDDVTVAEAAHRLLFARLHDDGPRCRSFRSASYYLRGLEHIAATDSVPERSAQHATLTPAGEAQPRSAEARGRRPTLAWRAPQDREMADQSSGQ